MNVYDFDKTVYKGDSSIHFYFYCLRKSPKLLLYLPKQMWGIALHRIGVISTTNMKERFFSFLTSIPDIDLLVNRFWEISIKNISDWYLQQKGIDDIIISASPAFLLKPICKTLNITNLIATNMDPHTGEISGENCKGVEKVRRFCILYSKEQIECFYSDSISDAPFAMLAKRAFLVKKNKIVPWRVDSNE